jgi:hypothetical protein
MIHCTSSAPFDGCQFNNSHVFNFADKDSNKYIILKGISNEI